MEIYTKTRKLKDRIFNRSFIVSGEYAYCPKCDDWYRSLDDWDSIKEKKACTFCLDIQKGNY